MKRNGVPAKPAKKPTNMRRSKPQQLGRKTPKIPTKKQKLGSAKPADPTLQAIGAAQYSIDLLIAFLLLWGQLSTTGIFVVPSGFAFSASGDIFHFTRVHGITQALSLDMDFIDVVLALLLIVGQIRVQGPYVSDSGLFVVLAGPIFGYESVPAPLNPFAPKQNMKQSTGTQKLQQTTEKSRLLGQILKEEALSSLSAE